MNFASKLISEQIFGRILVKKVSIDNPLVNITVFQLDLKCINVKFVHFCIFLNASNFQFFHFNLNLLF